MSIATISYGSLEDSAGEAKAVAKKLDTYAEHLNNSIYKKLTCYSGTHTVNINTAKTNTKAKISELEKKSSAYTIYSQDLMDLKNQCVETDKTVKSKVSQLTATFKKAYDIKNNPVVNSINYCLTSIKNSSFIGRWMNNTTDKINSLKEYIGQKVKVWWNYEGGKQFTISIISGVLAIAISICAIVVAWPAVLAILAGGALTWAGVVAVAAVVGGVISVMNGVVDIVNEGIALYETNKSENQDPALAKRISGENTIQDTIRRRTDSKLLHNLAVGIDIVSFVCDVIDIADGAKDLLKNGYKWTKEIVSDLDEIKMKDVFTKDTGVAFSSKIKINMSEGVTNVKEAVRAKNWDFFKDKAQNFGTDFMNNLKKNLKNDYANFDTVEDGLKSIKNSFDMLTEGREEFLSINDTMDKFILPNITIASVINLQQDVDGQMRFEFSEGITAQDIVSTFKTMKESFEKYSIFSSDVVISKDIISKLSEVSSVNIGIPKIKMPKVGIVTV